MKKIALFCSAALLALGFSACEDKSDLGIPQVNPQETVMSAGGITVAYGAALQGTTLDLNDYVGQQIPVIALNLTEEQAAELPAGADVTFTMDLATTADYSDATTLPVVNGAVSCEAWDEYFRQMLGKSPAAKDNYVRFTAYINENGQSVRVGGQDTYFAAKQLTVTPVPMDFTIDEAYYMIGTCNSWSLTAGDVPFSHSPANVYDDPVFTLAIEITEADIEANNGWWWKIAPQTAVTEGNWDAVVGVETDGDTALEGSLVDGGNAGCIKEAGNYIVTINMMDMTYSFKAMSYLYTPGNSNGWSQTDSQLIAYNADKGYYEGYAYLDGGFKFTDAPNWNGTNYGAGAEEGVLDTDGGAGNLDAPVAGLYYCKVDVANLTYTITLIESYGAIGGMNGWGSQENLTPSADFLTWTGDVTFGADDEWKFRANDDWGINLGGSLNDLVFDGSNLASPGAGTYTVTLNFSSLPYTATCVAK